MKDSGTESALRLPLLDGLPARSFRTILSDVPWSFKSYTAAVGSRAVPYATMTLSEIKSLPVASLAHPEGCHLFFWTTGPHLPQAFEVISAWGFKYSTVAMTWAKLKRSHNPNQLRVLPSADGDFHVGLGYTTRKNCEFLLLARRGGAKRLVKDVRELIIAPVREHSRKPDEVHARIERYSAGPFLELFGRQSRPNWIVRGNETEKFDGTI